MLGLSLTKILFTILVIVVVWKGFGLVNRLAGERRGSLGQRAANRPAWRGRRRGATVELVQCRHCGAYFDPAEGCDCRARAG